MAALNDRVGRLEGQMEHVIAVLDRVATNQAELDKALTILAESSEEQFRRTQEQFRETDRRLNETRAMLDEHVRETGASLEKMARDQKARDQVLDARIDKLVSGIGEFIRQPGSKPS